MKRSLGDESEIQKAVNILTVWSSKYEKSFRFHIHYKFSGNKFVLTWHMNFEHIAGSHEDLEISYWDFQNSWK